MHFQAPIILSYEEYLENNIFEIFRKLNNWITQKFLYHCKVYFLLSNFHCCKYSKVKYQLAFGDNT